MLGGLKLALWNFSFYIINEKNEKLIGINEEELLSWKNITIDSKSMKKLVQVFAEHESLGGIIRLGSEEKTNIEFLFENNCLLEIQANIDLRNMTIEELNCILDFMNSNDAVIFCYGRIYRSDRNELTKLLKGSNAYRFCENPIKFFQNK